MRSLGDVTIPRWRSRQPSTAMLAGLAGMAVILAALQWTLVAFSGYQTWNVVLAAGWSLLALWHGSSLTRRLRAGETVRSKHGDGASWWHL